MELKKSQDVEQHIFAFFNLLIIILKRRALYLSFEKNLYNKDTEENIISNSFVSYYVTDYARGQLIDLRKFFEVDRSSYRLTDLIRYIGSDDLQTCYNDLDKIWKGKFKDQVDKQIAHIDRNAEELRRVVAKNEIDELINKMDILVMDIIKNLKGKGSLVIQEELRDPEGRFLKLEQAAEFKKYLEWSSRN